MEWKLINKATGSPLNQTKYISEDAALRDLFRLGETFSKLYMAVPDYKENKWNTILLEGLHRGDLEKILLPQISIDVYVPSDPKTDNIVIGFLIKGVPEAVFPFKNFCQYSHGVRYVDYGDSDTLPNTNIVYVEFDRSKFDIKDLFDLVDQVSRLANIKQEDFSVNFPNSNKTFPFTLEVIKSYFKKRDIDKNRLSQYKANIEKSKQIQKEIEKELDMGTIGQRLNKPESKNQIKYSMINPNIHSNISNIKKLQQPIKPLYKKKTQKNEFDIPDTIESSIIADAKRNRITRQYQWKDFDMLWANRIHVNPTRISSIRKKIYEKP
jgi:hypothetical protein